MSNNDTRQEPIEILLVDDRESNLLTLESVLNSPDYRLVKLTSGADTLKYLLNHEPAVILLDVQMPDMDGFETASIIKQNVRTRDIPIIFVTAINHDERYVQQGYQHGAVDYIHKPYDPQILKSKVAVFAELVRKTRRLVDAERQIRHNEWKEREARITQLELRNLKREQADQRKYLDLVEGISHGIVWSADPDSLQVNFVSPSAEKIAGYPPEQWRLEKNFFLTHTHEADREKVVENLLATRAMRKEFALEHRFIARDGREIWFHTGLRLSQSDASRQEIRALSVDITKIKDAERVLLQNKRRSDFLAEAGMILNESLDYEATLARLGNLCVPRLADHFAIHVVNADNETKLLSLTHKDGPKGALVKEFFEHPLDPEARIGVTNVLRTSQAELYGEVDTGFFREHIKDPARLASLSRFPVRSMMYVPLIARDRVFGVMTFMISDSNYRYSLNDLSMAEDLARRAAIAIDNAHFYQLAQSAVQVRDEFLSVASHELKTPLTPLKLQTQILMRMLKSDAIQGIDAIKLKKILETSDRQLERLSRLIDDLLDISRISNGQLALNPERFDYVHLLHETIDRFTRQLENARCELELELPESLEVCWDYSRAEQVFTNLLTNAIKYGQGKPIKVSVRVVDGIVRTSVVDHGIGIARQDLNRIFNRFERAVSGSHFSGLGLGLYIVSQILAAHSGKIEVESSPGQGSTFTYSIPQEIAAANSSGNQEISSYGLKTQDLSNPASAKNGNSASG